MQDMKTEHMSREDIRYAEQMLRAEDYNPVWLADELRKFSDRFDYSSDVLADLTLCAMAMGHVEVAEVLVGAGVRPGSGRGRVPVIGDFYGVGHSIDGRGLTVLYLLASISPATIVVDGGASGKRRPRKEVLERVLANPDIWGGNIDALYGQTTALIRSQSIDKHAGALKHFPTGALPGIADMQERTQFQEALIQAGANINHPESRWSFLGASIPMAPADGSQGPVDMSEITRAIDFGADRDLGAPGAWAQAILQDAPGGYKKGQGPGQRGLALAQAGVRIGAAMDDAWDFSPIYRAFLQNARWAVREMIDRGVDIGAWRDKTSGRSVLHFVAGSKKSAVMLDMVPRAQLQGAVMSRSSDGQTPLHEAVAVLDPALVKRYLALGADPGATNSHGQTPLEGMRVISPKMQSQFEAIFASLDAAGGVTVGRSGTTALHKAALMLSVDTCRTLIDRGWAVKAQDKAGNTPLEVALFGHQQSMDALFNDERGLKQVQVMELFAEHGVDLFAQREFGRTLLHEAMGFGNHRVAIALLEAGADPNAEDELGLTPMHMWGISEHLRKQRRDNPKMPEVEVPGRTLSTRLIKTYHHPSVQELFRAFLKAGGQVGAERFGMPTFGDVRQNARIAAAFDAEMMDFTTAKIDVPGPKPRRI